MDDLMTLHLDQCVHMLKTKQEGIERCVKQVAAILERVPRAVSSRDRRVLQKQGGRFAGTHGGVLNLHTGFFPRAKPSRATPHHTTPHTTHHAHNNTPQHQNTKRTSHTLSAHIQHTHNHFHFNTHAQHTTRTHTHTHMNAWIRAQTTVVRDLETKK